MQQCNKCVDAVSTPLVLTVSQAQCIPHGIIVRHWLHVPKTLKIAEATDGYVYTGAEAKQEAGPGQRVASNMDNSKVFVVHSGQEETRALPLERVES